MLDKLLDFIISTLRIFQFWVVIYPQIETVRGLGPKYHVSITKHTYVTVQ